MLDGVEEVRKLGFVHQMGYIWEACDSWRRDIFFESVVFMPTPLITFFHDTESIKTIQVGRYRRREKSPVHSILKKQGGTGDFFQRLKRRKPVV